MDTADMFKMVKRFKFKEEAKIITNLLKVGCGFNLSENPISEEEAIKRDFGIVDVANICLVSGKSEEAKRLLSRFKDEGSEDKKFETDYKTDKIAKSGFSIEMIKTIIDFFASKDKDKKIDITLREDYPITLEDEDFKFILAPIIEGGLS